MTLLIRSLCVNCNKEIYSSIFNDNFTAIFLKVILPLVLLVPLLVTYRIASQKAETSAVALKSPVVSLSIILGIGLGGFVDAIILHQLLQWHQMISNILQPTDFTTKSINMFWDGVFEAVSWIFTFVGVLLMWHSRKKSKFTTSTAVFGGGLLAGWGIFNLLDSIFNHFLFRLHDIRENATDSRLYNLGFLIISLLLIVIGSFLMKKSKVDS